MKNIIKIFSADDLSERIGELTEIKVTLPVLFKHFYVRGVVQSSEYLEGEDKYVVTLAEVEGTTYEYQNIFKVYQKFLEGQSKVAQELRKLEEKFKNDVTRIMAHLPLSLEPAQKIAAKLSTELSANLQKMSDYAKILKNYKPKNPTKH